MGEATRSRVAVASSIGGRLNPFKEGTAAVHVTIVCTRTCEAWLDWQTKVYQKLQEGSRRQWSNYREALLARAAAAVEARCPSAAAQWEGDVDVHPGIRVFPVRTPTLPPATHTNCYVVGAGSEITITGSGFSTNAGDNLVLVGLAAAPVLAATESELRVLVPLQLDSDLVGPLRPP